MQCARRITLRLMVALRKTLCRQCNEFQQELPPRNFMAIEEEE